MEHPAARKISLTGSTAVGRLLAAEAGRLGLRMSMELGGNAPFLVFDDADVDAAVGGALVAKMRNNGEACTAANRFVVHRALARTFTECLSERMAALRMGHGLRSDTDVGPLIDAAAQRDVTAVVEQAIEAGAQRTTPVAECWTEGYFVPPTVLANVAPGSAILDHEIFGPVAPVVEFDTEEQAIRIANATTSGLAAYVYTENIHRALRVTHKLEVGMVGLNRGMISNPAAPFGGVKQSGQGREGGSQGIDEYVETKYISIAR
jgi:succinate-semialdehyde dehydrogenase/glutarate-semialdehyde dehydrogenase